MSRIEEFPESQIIPFDTAALVTSSIHFSIGVIGFLAVGLVLLSTTGEKNKTPRILLLLSLWDTHPWTYTLKIIAVMVILSTVIGMTYCYYAIVLLYVNTQKKVRVMRNAPVTGAGTSMAASQIESVPVTTSPKVNEHSVDILSIREKRLMFTAITITGCFVFLWTPYLIMMIAEMFTGTLKI
ncbi:hypothetical protein HDV03_005011 [Kappamyces sp. JEL0829]|nr:hypothetical protein HDV03_005011 [Kappamyces sp. JEL0829]